MRIFEKHIDERIALWRKSVHVPLLGSNCHEKKRVIKAELKYRKDRVAYAATLASEMRSARLAQERLDREQRRSLEKSSGSSSDSR